MKIIERYPESTHTELRVLANSLFRQYKVWQEIGQQKGFASGQISYLTKKILNLATVTPDWFDKEADNPREAWEMRKAYALRVAEWITEEYGKE